MSAVVEEEKEEEELKLNYLELNYPDWHRAVMLYCSVSSSTEKETLEIRQFTAAAAELLF